MKESLTASTGLQILANCNDPAFGAGFDFHGHGEELFSMIDISTGTHTLKLFSAASKEIPNLLTNFLREE